MSRGRTSYPPADNLTRMVDGLVDLHTFPYPTYFRQMTGNPQKWPKNIKNIYNTNRSFFSSIKKTLPVLNYDEFSFLRNELKLIKEENIEIIQFLEKVKPHFSDQELYDQFTHFLYQSIKKFDQPIRCFVLTDQGQELIQYNQTGEISKFYHLLFLAFLLMPTNLFTRVLQHPLTLNVGKKHQAKTAKELEPVFDLIIKPQFKGRDTASTESKNIRRWLEYFGLLNKGDIYHFDSKRFKLIIVGSLTRYLNRRFNETPTLLWQSLKQDIISKVHLDPDIINVEVLFDVIIKANNGKMDWIPSERGEEEFKGHKDKQVLQIHYELSTPRGRSIEGSDFLTIPPTPMIENSVLIRPDKLDHYWRE